MIGPADVIANRLGRPTPDEDGPGMCHLRGQCIGIFYTDFKVFWRDPVGQNDTFAPVADGDDGAEITPAGPGDGPPFKRFEPLFHGGGHGPQALRVGVAWATAAVQTPGTGVPPAELIDLDAVEVSAIE